MRDSAHGTAEERKNRFQAIVTQQSHMAETAEATLQALMARYFNA